MFPLEVETLARLLVDEVRERHLRVTTAESCTGGLVAAAICSIPGASDVFDRGFVTYTNRAKQEMLGVPGRHDRRLGRGVRGRGPDDGRGRPGQLPCPYRGGDHRRGRPGRRVTDEAGRHGAYRHGEEHGRAFGIVTRCSSGETRLDVQMAAVAVALQMMRDAI
jgi:nicotinamide-nucleotide amidase